MDDFRGSGEKLKQSGKKVKKKKSEDDRVADAEGKLTLYYLLPGEKFATFVTDPVNRRKNGARCNIKHVRIPNPSEEEK